MTDAMTKPGSVIDGKYRIEALLGEGAVGMVVKAYHLEVGTHVALKFLLPRMQADPVVVERFAREARASALITSEHVARVFDVGQTEETGPYIVMEYLSGETVSDALKRLKMLPIQDACAYMVQVCQALSEAHARGIIHRDLKPANLFITKRSSGKALVKVLDFGISKLGGDAISVGDGELTMASTILGTPLYMAPEQIASSRTVDGRADIWSCGICLHRMLSGNVPFDADSLPALGAKLLTTKAPNLNTLRPAVPRELAAIVLRCLEKDIEQRWQIASDLGRALERFAGPRATVGGRPAAIEDPPSLPTIAVVEPSEAETRADLTRDAVQARALRASPVPSPSPLRQPEIVDVTLMTLNEAAPLGTQRPSHRPSSAPPPPQPSHGGHVGGFEEELPTIRLPQPPVSRELHRRSNRPPPPAAGVPYHVQDPGPPPAAGRPLPCGPVMSHSGAVANHSGSVNQAYYATPSRPEPANHSGAYPSQPRAMSSRNAPTVRGLNFPGGRIAGRIQDHPYFGVGLVFLISVVIVALVILLRP